jgi:hypothetical protein
VLAALLAGAALLALYARGGGPVPDALGFLRPKGFDPLSASSPPETALRTLRLAGFDHAVVGESGGTAVARVAMPAVSSPAKVELSWQTALVAGARAYPHARTVVAQLFAADGTPLLEVSAEAAVVRSAAERDDAAGLRHVASFRYLASAGGSQ